MIDAYSLVGDALFAFVSGLDITAVEPGGWAHRFNRPFEPDEVSTGGYPTVMVVPAEDEATTLDSHGDTDRIVYWAVLYTSIQETLMNGESGIRALADLVRNQVKAERGEPEPFGLTNVYDLHVSGTWGWDTERAERFYRIVVTVHVAQDFE